MRKLEVKRCGTAMVKAIKAEIGLDLRESSQGSSSLSKLTCCQCHLDHDLHDVLQQAIRLSQTFFRNLGVLVGG